MTDKQKLTLGPLITVIDVETFEFQVPEWIIAEGTKFVWDSESSCYPGLYIEPVNHNGLLTEDSYYEIEED